MLGTRATRTAPQFEFQTLVALEKPRGESGLGHYFWKSPSLNSLKIAINAPDPL